MMHTAQLRLTSASGCFDSVTIPFGVRSLSFNASHGLRLNGVETKLYGGCVHHDHGPLGAMSIDRAEASNTHTHESHSQPASVCLHTPSIS